MLIPIVSLASQLFLLLAASRTIQGQRAVEPCFSHDFLRNCKSYTKPELTEEIEEALNEVCFHVVVDYFFEDWFMVEDPSARIQQLGSIPKHSEVCEELSPYMPHCYWCVQEFVCFENYTLSCTEGVQPVPGTGSRLDEETPGGKVDFMTLHDLCTELKAALVGIDWNHSLHYDNLVHETVLEADQEWCSLLRWAYPRCYFCKQDVEPQDYCSIQDMCETDAAVSNINDNNSTLPGVIDGVNVEDTCEKLDILLDEQWEKTPLSADLCDRAAVAISHGSCRERHCAPCLDGDYPDLCASLAIHEETSEFDLEILVYTCWDLWFELYMDPYNRTYHSNRLGQFRQANKECPYLQKAYSRCFWCDSELTAEEVPCDVQPVCWEEPLPLSYMDPALRSEFRPEICEELQELTLIWIFPTTADLCQKARKYGEFCACVEPKGAVEFDYLGADTTAKKRALIWISRVAALLSMAGGMYILWDSLSTPEKRRAIYHQLLIGMAMFDICTAIAWSFASAPVDATDIDGGGYNVEGAIGTEATCKAQAFFVQLGVASIFYNVSLATYYAMVIVYGKGESYLQTKRWYLHGFPILVGCGLALGGLPRYGYLEYACHFSPLPSGDITTLLIFVLIPIGLSISYITLVMLRVYAAVRTASRPSRRSSMRGTTATMEDNVFWQSCCYAISFYVTRPTVFCVYFGGLDSNSYGFSVVVAFVAPLQGFNNFLVYIRPRYTSWLERRKVFSCCRRVIAKLQRKRYYPTVFFPTILILYPLAPLSTHDVSQYCRQCCLSKARAKQTSSTREPSSGARQDLYCSCVHKIHIFISRLKRESS